MAIPVLYSFRRCPYAMRARLALQSAGITVELREILLRDKPDEMIRLSPKATVPVLVSNGKILEESRDIMDWALAQNDPEGWLNGYAPDLVIECETKFKDALDKYKYASRFTDVNPQDQRKIAAEYLHKLDKILNNQPYLSGVDFGYNDAAILTFIRQFANVDRGWFEAQNWPELAKWLENFLQSERFSSIMQKYPVWQAGNEPIYFPEQQ